VTSSLPAAELLARGSPSSRAKPYPYDLLFAGADFTVGLMAREGMVGRRITPVSNAVPTDQSYESSDLYQERSTVFRRPLLGFGGTTQAGVAGGTPRYAWAHNAWIGNGAYRGLGPRWRPFTAGALGAAAGEHAGFVEGLHTPAGAGQVRLFVLAGRYVRRWDGDTAGLQALSLDLGAGVVAEGAARWHAAGLGGQDALYLTDSAARLWRYQGGVWAQIVLTGTPGFTLPAGTPDATGAGARFVKATGPELWRAWGNRLAKCELDPGTPANWTAFIEVGDASVPITGLGEIDERLLIFKADGTVWGLQGGLDTGTARDLVPAMRTTQSRDWGKRPAAWLDPQSGAGALYVPGGGGSLYRVVAPGGVGVGAQIVGPERLADNTTPLRGPVTAFTGYGGWCGYGTQYNAQTGTGYLLQFGTWLPETTLGGGAGGGAGGGPGEPEAGPQMFVEAWHGALVVWPAARPTSLHVTTLEHVVGTPAGPTGTPAQVGGGGNPVLLAGFSDGTYGWCRLPRDGPNPFSEGAHLAPTDFVDTDTAAAFVRWPREGLAAPGDTKLYLSVAASGPVVDSSRWLGVRYRVDAPGGLLGLGGTDEGGWEGLVTPLTGTPEAARAYFPPSRYGKVIELEEHYHALSPAAGDPLEDAYLALGTPVVAALVLRQQLRPAFRVEYAWTSPAHDRVARRDGASARYTPVGLRNQVVRAAQDPGLVTLVLPYEIASSFSLIEYREVLPPAGRLRRRGLAFDLQLSAVAYRTVTDIGTWQRLADLGYTTWASLPPTTWQALSVL
jgi:hypothetical protein